MEDARLLDGQDRFLNSKAAKYAIRNGEMERAEKTIGLFTRVRLLSPAPSRLYVPPFPQRRRADAAGRG